MTTTEAKADTAVTTSDKPAKPSGAAGQVERDGGVYVKQPAGTDDGEQDALF